MALNARIMASIHLSAWELSKPFDMHMLPDMWATKYCYNKSLVSKLKNMASEIQTHATHVNQGESCQDWVLKGWKRKGTHEFCEMMKT